MIRLKRMDQEMSIWSQGMISDYSRGQAKPTNLVSQQGRYLEPRFFQILVPICEIRRKTHLRSFAHEKLVRPNFWT